MDIKRRSGASFSGYFDKKNNPIYSKQKVILKDGTRATIKESKTNDFCIKLKSISNLIVINEKLARSLIVID